MAPALTVTTGWWAMASRSADTSPVTSAPRWTPPIPPVANTAMPAAAASASDADTVVAPNDHRWATATARSRSAALRAGPRIRSCSSGVDADSGHAVEHGGDAPALRRRRGSPRCTDRAPRGWPATAGRGGRRSSTPAPRPDRPAASAPATSADRLRLDHDRGPSLDETGDDLDVGRVRERVDDRRALVAVAGLAEQPWRRGRATPGRS